MKKSPKKMTKCQGMYSASENDCHRSGCKHVKPKSGASYCRSPMKRRPRKSPMRKISKCQGKNGASLGDCHKIGCNFVKPKVGLTYCRSPMKRRSKSPKRYAKKTRKSPTKSPVRMNIVELD